MSVPPKVVQLTPPGKGAVAVVQATWPQEADACRLNEFFRSKSGIDAATATVGRILYGLWDGEGVVVVRTGPCVWEIHCHGGSAAIERIRSQLIGTSPEVMGSVAELPERTDWNSGIDSEDTLENAVLVKLLECRTEPTALRMLAQHQGVLRTFLAELLRDPQGHIDRIDRFLGWKAFAEHLTEPWRVAVVGQPNAGKSSLLNAVVGYDRTIVCDQPGTTRDRVDVDIALEGWPFHLIDTAGIRDASDGSIEAQGIEIARQTIQTCDLCLLVVDSQQGWTKEDQALADQIPASAKRAVLWNKSDLENIAVQSSNGEFITGSNFSISAKTGEGISKLLSWIVASLNPVVPEISEPLPVLPDIWSLVNDIRFGNDESAAAKLQALLQR